MPALVLFRMGKLTQGQRNAVVMWCTPIENGTLPQVGLGLIVAKARSKLKFLFKVDVTFNNRAAFTRKCIIEKKDAQSKN